VRKRRDAEIQKEKSFNLMERCLREKLKSGEGQKFKQTLYNTRSNPKSRAGREAESTELVSSEFKL